jgi:hypothetical protein
MMPNPAVHVNRTLPDSLVYAPSGGGGLFARPPGLLHNGFLH